MPPHGYAEIEHCADLALKVWGEDFTSVLRQALAGMLMLMGVKVDASISYTEILILPDGSPEENLVDFLTEVLYLLEEKGVALINSRSQKVIRSPLPALVIRWYPWSGGSKPLLSITLSLKKPLMG